MGFLDLSTSVASKKHVDFNDARYQLSDKLRQSSSKNIRATFTLYDNKDVRRTAIQDISAAYALSDKRLPIGELLNKMIDLITDMEDGKLDTELNAVYTWKYSQAILAIFDDKIKRQEALTKFDNSLKYALTTSAVFSKKYPGKYTNRTNFFDKSIKESLLKDIVETFKEVALPGIHEAAIAQSREVAEKHENPILDKIVTWAVENYECEVDSFFHVQEDPATKLLYSTNTIIIHLNNGYDMSIVGYVGTEADDKFAISIFDAQNISLEGHSERISENEIQSALSDASKKEAINPLTKLLSEEKKKNEVLKQQYDILFEIRPMIPAETLALQAAESVVGADYIWGCDTYRQTHEDLPADFSLDDVELPEYEGDLLTTKKKERLTRDLESMANALEVSSVNSEKELGEKVADAIEGSGARKISHEAPAVAQTTPSAPVVPTEAKKETTVESPKLEVLFDDEPKKKVESRKFGDPEKKDFNMPMLSIPSSTPASTGATGPGNKPTTTKTFDTSATLLPGVTPVVEVKEEPKGPSVTAQAKPMPSADDSGPKWKDAPETTLPTLPITPDAEPTADEKKEQPKDDKKDGPKTPDLVIDDIDSLFE